MTRLIARCARYARPMTRLIVCAFAFLATTAVVARSQNVDSLIASLSSTQVSVRAMSLGALSDLPLTALTPGARSAIIRLLDLEASGSAPATDTVAAGSPNELYGEYIISLTSLAAKFNDPRALRGLAMIGLVTSLAVEDFVASQGAAAIPILDTAFTTSDDVRSSVVSTWGRMLLITPPLDSAPRMAALLRIARNAVPYPSAVAAAASETRSVSLLPALFAAYAADTDALSRARLTPALSVLRTQEAAESAPQLLGDLSVGIAAACAGASGNGQGACEAVQNLIAAATRHVQRGETAAAHNTLAALSKRAGDGQAAGELTPALAQFLQELARMIDGKL